MKRSREGVEEWRGGIMRAKKRDGGIYVCVEGWMAVVKGCISLA